MINLVPGLSQPYILFPSTPCSLGLRAQTAAQVGMSTLLFLVPCASQGKMAAISRCPQWNWGYWLHRFKMPSFKMINTIHCFQGSWSQVALRKDGSFLCCEEEWGSGEWQQWLSLFRKACGLSLIKNWWPTFWKRAVLCGMKIIPQPLLKEKMSLMKYNSKKWPWI